MLKIKNYSIILCFLVCITALYSDTSVISLSIDECTDAALKKSYSFLLTELKKKAIHLRRDILTMLEKAGSGHTGGSLSIVEILTALYYRRMNVSADKCDWKGRDKFVLSKGHTVLCQF